MKKSIILSLGLLSWIGISESHATCLTSSQAQQAIQAKHAANPWIGAPVGALTGSLDQGGWHQQFSNQNVSIWVSACNGKGAHIVQGLIHAAYDRVGNQKSLGFPLTDELKDSNNNPFSDFENGSIWYQWGNPSAFAVQGFIQNKWNFLDTYKGALGYPTSDEKPYSSHFFTGRVSDFKNGWIVYKNGGSWQTGTYPILKTPFWSDHLRYETTHKTQTSAVVQVSGSGFKPGSKLDLWLNNWQGNFKIQTKVADAHGNVEFLAQNFDTNVAGSCPYELCVLTFEVNDGKTQFQVVGAKM